MELLIRVKYFIAIGVTLKPETYLMFCFQNVLSVRMFVVALTGSEVDYPVHLPDIVALRLTVENTC